VDVAEIQEAVTVELKKVQKEEFSAAFQKVYDCANPVYMPLELILNKKRCVFDLKKISHKTFGPHCVGEFSFKQMLLFSARHNVYSIQKPGIWCMSFRNTVLSTSSFA
jgi:hypothetical protein